MDATRWHVNNSLVTYRAVHKSIEGNYTSSMLLSYDNLWSLTCPERQTLNIAAAEAKTIATHRHVCTEIPITEEKAKTSVTREAPRIVEIKILERAISHV